VPEIFPEARAIANGEFEIGALSLAEINEGVARLIQLGTLIRAMYPVHSALEQQFREAVGAPAKETAK
jgi:hypothetical protein